MGIGKGSAKGKSSKLAIVMYVGAIVSAAVFIYMVVSSISYINGYAASYGMGFSDMWADGIQYVLSSSANYIVYALVLFALGKILDIIQNEKTVEADEQPALSVGIITGDSDETETAEQQKIEEPAAAGEETQQENDSDDKSDEKAE